jgi:tetratricopeptide (TPR) repeat protein
MQPFRNQFQTRHPARIRIRGKPHTIGEAYALAIKEQALQNFQEAASIYDLILAKVPDVAEAHNNQGVMLQEMQRYDEALASFAKALAIKPGFAEAHNGQGAVFQKMERYVDALASFDKAIAFKPEYANAHFNRGSTLKILQRYEEALESFRKTIGFKPDHVEAYNNLGVTLQDLKRYDEALASYDQAIALNPDHAIAHYNRGNLFMIKGDMQEAEKMYLKVRTLNPDFSAPLFNLVKMRKYQTGDNADEKNIRDFLNQPGISPEDQEYLYFSLGKIYDDCGRYDEAFESYRLANQIRNAVVSYDSGGVTSLTDGIIEVFSRDFLEQPFAFASASRLPLFVVGMPRSGTTLMASILSNHPSIATAGELPNITDFTLRLPKLIKDEPPYPQAAKYITPAIATSLEDAYEQRLRRDIGPDILHVIDKNPLNFRNLGFIAMLFPQARIIHCTRHPLDTGLSNYFQRFPLYLDYSFDLQNIGHFYGEYARLMEHWRKVLPLKMLEIRYEDMVLDTEQMARKTLDFLGLEWDERCLAPHTNRCAVETASQWQVRQPIYNQSVGRWRHYEKHIVPLKEIFSLTQSPDGSS